MFETILTNKFVISYNLLVITIPHCSLWWLPIGLKINWFKGATWWNCHGFKNWHNLYARTFILIIIEPLSHTGNVEVVEVVNMSKGVVDVAVDSGDSSSFCWAKVFLFTISSFKMFISESLWVARLSLLAIRYVPIRKTTNRLPKPSNFQLRSIKK